MITDSRLTHTATLVMDFNDKLFATLVNAEWYFSELEKATEGAIIFYCPLSVEMPATIKIDIKKLKEAIDKWKNQQTKQ